MTIIDSPVPGERELFAAGIAALEATYPAELRADRVAEHRHDRDGRQRHDHDDDDVFRQRLSALPVLHFHTRTLRSRETPKPPAPESFHHTV